MPARQQVTAGDDAYVAGREMHVYLAPPVDSCDEGGPGPRLDGAAGVQVGSGNVQVNNFFYGSPAQADAGAQPVTCAPDTAKANLDDRLDPIEIFNSGIAAIQNGDRASAVAWFQRAAEAGNVEGFAALTQLARDAGLETAEAHWARLGAQAGHPFCVARHGLLLVRGAGGDVRTLRHARDLLEQAGQGGDIDSAALAVSVNHQLGDPARAQRFVAIVVRSGDAAAIDRLRRYGFL